MWGNARRVVRLERDVVIVALGGSFGFDGKGKKQ